MKDANVSGRYAKALLLLSERQAAKEKQPLVPLLERTLADLDGLTGLVRPGSRIGGFLADPQVRPDHKREVLRSGLQGRALQSVVVFADLLLRKKRLGVITEIARHFRVLVEHAQGLQHAQVVSAVALTAAERDRLHAQLERTTGKKIVLTSSIDPALVGGGYVRIGDRIVDRSVKTLLETISHQLYHVSV